MSRKDKPYLPLYVQDFLTDEKLMECSAESTGVYIRIMCVLHKSQPYGKLLLKQKDKQSESKIKNFAIRFAKHFPYTLDVILSSLVELVEEGCLEIDGDCIFQKRMVNDSGLSDLRSKSGSLGGRKAKDDDFALAKEQAKGNLFAIAKVKANADIDIDIENGIDNNKESVVFFEKKINPVDDTSWEKVKIDFYNDFRWSEKFCRDKSVTILFFKEKAREFISDIELKGDSKDLKELKSHFVNWYNIKIKNEPTNKQHQLVRTNFESMGADASAERIKSRLDAVAGGRG